MSASTNIRTIALSACILFAIGCGEREKGPTPNSTTVQTISFEMALADVLSGKTARLLVETPVGSSELIQINQASNLRELLLDGGVVSDQDLIERLTSLSLIHLRLRHSPITDLGLKHIVDTQPKLKILNLPHAKVTNKGLESLSDLSNLTHLRLGGRTIDDLAVQAISHSNSLESLHLIGPNLTDESLEFLANMKELSSLYIDDCRLSDSAWEKLFRKRPRMHVHVDQAHHDRDPNLHPH